LTLREEYRLDVFQKRALRRMFGPTKDKVTGDWRKLHNEELVLFAKYNYNDQVKEGEMGRASSTNGGKRGMHIGYWWESQKEMDHCEGHRWVDNIKMDL
jgi:hypothetical protein